MIGLRRPYLTGLVTAVSLACGGGGDITEPPPPDPGPVNLIFTTVNADDGIALLSISGGEVTTVQQAGFELLATAAGSSPVRILVRGALTSGVVATLILPDRRRLSDYTVQVEQVAARPSYVQHPPQGYSAVLVHP